MILFVFAMSYGTVRIDFFDICRWYKDFRIKIIDT